MSEGESSWELTRHRGHPGRSSFLRAPRGLGAPASRPQRPASAAPASMGKLNWARSKGCL